MRWADVRLDGAVLDPLSLTLLLHKPAGYVCSRREPEGGALVYDLLPARYAMRSPTLAPGACADVGLCNDYTHLWMPMECLTCSTLPRVVGRLDKMTSGLLIMTDDGQLLHRITSPKTDLWKLYDVVLARPLTGACRAVSNASESASVSPSNACVHQTLVLLHIYTIAERWCRCLLFSGVSMTMFFFMSAGNEAATFATGNLLLESESTPLQPAVLHVLGERHARLAIREGRYHQA